MRGVVLSRIGMAGTSPAMTWSGHLGRREPIRDRVQDVAVNSLSLRERVGEGLQVRPERA
jgi:hypothetical protein